MACFQFVSVLFAILLTFSSSAESLHFIHTEPPALFHPKMEVAGCYCECDGKFLMLLRSPNKPQGNTWCAPGGKLEKGETPDQALIRELREEIGLDIADLPFNYCRPVYVRFPNVDFVLHLYRVTLEKQPHLCIARAEHRDFCWVTPEEALCLPLIPGGDECVSLVFSD
ncbi:MAG: NUDIX domain-containing protein [Rhabdochlamydiaceae bacterium]|nr:NUDIX domain-containing protein [Rhabdochlamydiaceae bacterium]